MILVSACLLGIKAKYDGGENTVPQLVEKCKSGGIIPVCPEQLGGLTTPRLPCEIYGGTGDDVLAGKARVLAKDGRDVTKAFVEGAKQVLQIAQIFGVKAAILKERSPSCGCNYIYDGNFNGKKLTASGVTAALLKKHGIQVFSEYELEKVEY